MRRRLVWGGWISHVASDYRKAAGRPIVSYNRWNGKFGGDKGWEGKGFLEKLLSSGADVVIHAPKEFDVSTFGVAVEDSMSSS